MACDWHGRPLLPRALLWGLPGCTMMSPAELFIFPPCDHCRGVGVGNLKAVFKHLGADSATDVGRFPITGVPGGQQSWQTDR